MFDFDNFMKWVGYIAKFSLGYILLGGLIIALIFWPERIFFWISKVQALFLWTGTKFKKSQIETEIKANIMKVRKEVSKEMEEVLPYDLKIKWITSSNREAFFDGKDVVVCMDNKSNNRMCSIVHAINDYVHNGLLVNEKIYVDDRVMKSSCLVLTRKLLMLSFDKGLPIFFNEILKVETEKDTELKVNIDALISLDENGLFTQVFLRELKEKGSKMLGKANVEEFKSETNNFVSFLYEIATRGPRDKTQLHFRGKYYNSSILLVANYDNYISHGTDSYTKRFENNIKQGNENIYLCARNNKRIIAEKVYEQLKFKYPDAEGKTFHYTGCTAEGDTFKGVCIAVKVHQKDKKIKSAS